MTWLGGICLKAYGEFTDLTVGFGEHLTVVYGTNEAGKSTAHDAVNDFLWGIPTRSPRASYHARSRLTIEADLHLDTGTVRCVRRSTGLSRVNGTAFGAEPWNPDGSLDRRWWENHFRVNHHALRAGGAAVLKATQGASDIADLIFIARRGEVAHTLCETLSAQLEKVYATDKRRQTELRAALEKLDVCKAKLQVTLMRADDVEHHRALLEAAERDVSGAETERKQTQTRLSTARAHARVIDHVLAYVAAEAELGELDAAGPRLEPDELRRYHEALGQQSKAEADAKRAREEAEDLQGQIAELAVDADLLTAGDDIDALANELKAREEDLDKLLGTHRPDAERHAGTVRTLLTGLGVDLAEGVEAGLARSRIPIDLAATLDDLANRVEGAEQERARHRGQREEALGRLTDRGVLLDPATSRPLPETEVTNAKRELREAQTAVGEQKGALERVREEIAEIPAAQDLPPLGDAVSQQHVTQVRAERDAVWVDIQSDWVQGPVRSVEDRQALAEQFTGLLRNADEVGDRDADRRATLEARHAVAEVHDSRLRNLREQVAQHTELLRGCAARVVEAEDAWQKLWARAGIMPPPGLDQASPVLVDLTLVHKESGLIRGAEGCLQELTLPWAAAARDAGLPESATPAAWHARSNVLQQIETASKELDKTHEEIDKIERRGEAYGSRALQLIKACDPSSVSSKPEPREIAAGIRALHRRLAEHRDRQARATELQKQVEIQRKAERLAIQEAGDARTRIDALRDAHRVDDDALTRMAARGDQATGPIQRMEESITAIRTAWPEASPRDVIRTLRERDRATVDAERQEADEAFNEAHARVSELSGKRGAQLKLLEQVESKEGADEALEQVRAAEATVTDLAAKWLQLRLQVELLKRVIASQGDEGSLPLLAEAGQILERLTGSRWVALQPAPGHGVRALRVLRADEREAAPEELSEGTLDQVYLALRLAAVRELHRQRAAAGKPALPLVLDDALMAFDADRTREALVLLSDLARDMQIIVFTHHAYVAEQARGLTDVHVAELPAPGPITGDRDPEDVRATASYPRPVAGTVSVPPTRMAATSGRAEVDPKVVRAWAEAEGLMEPGRRGRIPADVLDQYKREQAWREP